MDDPKIGAEKNAAVHSLWHRLTKLTSLTFTAESEKSNSGWSGVGQGSVCIKMIDDDTLLFHEDGDWSQSGGKTMRFTNVFRWTKIVSNGSVRLEHLRFGPDRPVYLFDLKSTAAQLWSACDGHVCRNDVYTATLEVQAKSLDLHWTVSGPTMHESIHYIYF